MAKSSALIERTAVSFNYASTCAAHRVSLRRRIDVCRDLIIRFHRPSRSASSHAINSMRLLHCSLLAAAHALARNDSRYHRCLANIGGVFPCPHQILHRPIRCLPSPSSLGFRPASEHAVSAAPGRCMPMPATRFGWRCRRAPRYQ